MCSCRGSEATCEACAEWSALCGNLGLGVFDVQNELFTGVGHAELVARARNYVCDAGVTNFLAGVGHGACDVQHSCSVVGMVLMMHTNCGSRLGRCVPV